MIKGYKAFNKNKTNRYGVPFECGQLYSVEGPIKFGNNGNGFHMCSFIADVFRYFDASDVNNYVIADVYGFGDFQVYDDEYEGYYDMYAVRHLYIQKFLEREEVFERIRELSEWQIIKVIKTSKLLPEEIEYIKNKFSGNVSVICALLYYQLDQKDIYEKYYKDRNVDAFNDVFTLRKVNKNGQDNS